MKTHLSAAAVFAVACVAVFSVWINWRAKTIEEGLQDQGQKILLQGKAAPEIALSTLDGHNISLASYRGNKKVLVAFWASWCGPCRAEMPALARFYERTHKPDAAYEILAISLDEDRSAAEAFVKENKVSFPVLLDPWMKAANAFEAASIPATFIVDPSGKITYGHLGFEPGAEMRFARELGLTDYFPFRGGMDGRRGN